jgi:multidrug efflux pump subunit AcrB
MLKTILTRQITVIMIFIAVTVFGIISYQKLPVNLLPDIKYPSLTVWTELDGSSPEQVERLITEPLEASIAGLKDIIKIRSESKESISLITIDFSWGTDMDFAVLYLREKLDAASLPETAGRPNILRVDPASKPIMIISVSGRDQKTAREISENVIKKRIEQIEGVAMADVIGGEETDIRIEADLEKLNSYGLTFNHLLSGVRSSSTNSPGGTVKDDVYTYDLVISSEFKELSDIENTPVKQLDNKRNIYVKDIAKVSYQVKEKKSFTRYNAVNSTAVLIRKDGDANAVLVAKDVRKILGEFEETTDTDINVVYDQSEFITESIDNVVSSILLGGILSFLTLFLFLREFKSPFNISLAMPISIFSTFTLLYFSKISLNLMSLSGFALGIGMLVDNSIVVLENINRHRSMNKSVFDSCYDGVKEVIMPVSASTFTTIIVFMPVVFVSGVAGELFKDQSVSVVFALISSLFVSITLVPVLYNKFSIEHKDGGSSDESLKSDNGPIFKTGIYWTILILLYFGIIKLSKIPVDEHAFAYMLFLALLTDPFVKTLEFFIFYRKHDELDGRKKLRFTAVTAVWFLILLVLALPAAYISKVDYFEPVHAMISFFTLNCLNWLDGMLYDVSSFINGIFQPYEEELSTKTYMLYAYSLGGIVFFINLFGLFNPAKFYGISKSIMNDVFLVEKLRSFFKNIFKYIFGFFAGLSVFWFKTTVKAVKFIFKPVLYIFDRSYLKFENLYKKILLKALDNRGKTYAFTAFVLLIAVVLMLSLERRMMPDVDSHEFILTLEMNPGTGINTTESVIRDYEQILVAKEGVRSVFATGGVFDEKSLLTGAAVYKGEIQVKLENDSPTKGFLNELRKEIAIYNSSKDFDIKVSFNTDVSVLGELLKSEEGDISIKITGSDLDDLREITEKVTNKLKGFKGLSEISSDFNGNKPQIRIDFNTEFLENNDITELEVTNFIRTMIKGETATQITENNKSVDIIVGTDENFNDDIKNITGSSYVRNGTYYPLEKLVSINFENGPESISHESQSRVITVTANVTEGRLDKVIDDVKNELDKIDLYRRMRIETGGQNKEMQDSMKQIMFMFLLSLILVYMVMAAQFESLLSPFIIVMSIPFSFIGVAAGLYLTGQTINVLSGIGMIMLVGISVNNAIVAVDFIDTSVKEGLDIRTSIVQGIQKRLRPMLMTTITTVFGMVPMAVAWGGSSELRKPLAITVIFGLSVATLLTLTILPVVYETIKIKKK